MKSGFRATIIRSGLCMLFALYTGMTFAQVTIGTGTSTQSNIPVYTLYEYTASEIIYLGSEINTTGNITEIAFNKASGTSTAVTPNVTIYMKNTSATTVGTTTSLTDYVSVWTGSFPNSASGWQAVTLSTPFSFPSTASNLSILIVNNSNSFIGSGRPSWTYTSTSSNYRAAYYSSSSTPWASSGAMTRTYSRPNIRLAMSAAISCNSATFPASVSTQASKTIICSEESLSFSLGTAMPSATGITYQWKSSADNVTYTNSGSAGTSPTATITANASAKWFKCEILCNGSPVRTSTPVEITLQVQVLTTIPGNRCGTGTVSLGAAAVSGNVLNWYAASTGGSSLGTGNAFTTPSISGSTHFYVGASGGGSTAQVGPAAPASVSASYGSTNNGDAMIFNAAQAFQLTSVTIYPVDAASNNVIYLKDASGNILQQLTFSTVGISPLSTTSSVGSAYVINLNWNVPAGTGLKLEWGVPDYYGANRVLRNTTGATALYNVASSGITFTGNTSGFGNGYWYSFYDWKISTSCGETARTAVLATVNAAPAGGTVSSSQLSCIYGTPDDLSLSGNAGTILKWQKSLTSDFASPGDLANTSATLTGAQMGALTQTTYYRALTEASGCTSASSTATITVHPYPNNVPATDYSSTDCRIMSPDHWAVLAAPDNTIIACVHDAPGGNDLGDITASVHLESTVPSNNSKPYMQRVVTITPASNGPAKVRLFFTQDEFDNLRLADPSLTSIGQLGVTKFAGNSVSGTGQYITPATISTIAETGMPGVYSLDIPVTGFSTFIIHNSSYNSPLPVSLTNFQVKHTDGRTAEISWATHSETNNDYFLVERSVDGQKFTGIAKTEGAGNSSHLLKYLAYDQDPENGINYYRLKQVDFDGKFTYSEIRSLDFKGGSGEIRLYPNPATHGATLYVAADGNEALLVRVSGMNGKIVESFSGNQQSGANTFFIGESLPAGIYNVSVTNGQSFSRNLKLVITE